MRRHANEACYGAGERTWRGEGEQEKLRARADLKCKQRDSDAIHKSDLAPSSSEKVEKQSRAYYLISGIANAGCISLEDIIVLYYYIMIKLSW